MSDSEPATPTDRRTVRRIVGVYDADGGMTGEVKYVVGHLLGRIQCALCDITHGPLRRKRVFDELRHTLGVPLVMLHRDERSADLAAAAGDTLPCVLAETDDGFVPLLDRDTLARCLGDVDRFEHELRASLEAQCLRLRRTTPNEQEQ